MTTPAATTVPGLLGAADAGRTLVMGIINVTPDSFSDGGVYADPREACGAGMAMLADGADLIDVGGESTRPGALPVPLDEELTRVVPVIEALAELVEVPISVDTSQPAVMAAAVAAGASIVNDVRALREPGALDLVAGLEVGVCVMHMQGEPVTMQLDPRYTDVVDEVGAFLAERIEACVAAGFARDRITVDPGFGFGKTLTHNLALLRGLPELAALGAPILVGLSRKGMIGELTGRSLGERTPGSVVAAVLAVQRGASIVRVHDVAATRDALAILAAIDEPE